MQIIQSKNIFSKHSFDEYIALTDETVAALYGHHFKRIITFPAGEKSKTRETKALLEDKLLAQGCTTNSKLLALGGGVVSDMTGFIAATFMRGIPYSTIPTTLLGMVDAAIGGKTGVNTPFGKNTIGAFHLPETIWIDTTFLQTLPDSEVANGWAEIIKYAYIEGLTILDQPLEDLIKTCINIKQQITKEDPRCQNKRNFLNFGHTVGHAIELASNYSISHGNAVAIGMMSAMRISGLDTTKLSKQLKQKGLKTETQIDPSILLDFIKRDKKGPNRFVLLEEIGKPIMQTVSDERILEALCCD